MVHPYAASGRGVPITQWKLFPIKALSLSFSLSLRPKGKQMERQRLLLRSCRVMAIKLGAFGL